MIMKWFIVAIILLSNSLFASHAEFASRINMADIIELVEVIQQAQFALQKNEHEAQVAKMKDIFDLIFVIKKSCELEIVELGVLQQGAVSGWENDGLNCGYHAIKNIQELLKVINHADFGKDLKIFNNLQNNKIYQDFMKIQFNFVRELIVRHWVPANEETYIAGGTIQHILNKMQNDMQFEFPVIVCEPTDATDPFSFPEQPLLELKKFAQVSDSILGIIWNTGINHKSSHGTHWVSFVAVKKNNCIKLYYMNSSKGMDPNFNIIEDLFKKTPKEIDEMIQEKHAATMNQDLFDIAKKVAIKKDDKDVFSQFLGCVEIKGPYPQNFSEQNLKAVGLTEDQAKKYITSLNKNWAEVRPKSPGKPEQQRIYSFWLNSQTQEVLPFVSDLTVAAFKERYKKAWIQFSDRDVREFVKPTLEDMGKLLLVNWKDYKIPNALQIDFTDQLKLIWENSSEQEKVDFLSHRAAIANRLDNSLAKKAFEELISEFEAQKSAKGSPNT